MHIGIDLSSEVKLRYLRFALLFRNYYKHMNIYDTASVALGWKCIQRVLKEWEKGDVPLNSKYILMGRQQENLQ